MKHKILFIAGARPNFVKIAPLIEQAKKHKIMNPVLVHTGQHYDFEMSDAFFQDLKIPSPKYNLAVGSGSHVYQIAEVMKKLALVFLKEEPSLVVVVGDVNSTLAAALTANKMNIPVTHVEAGLRSFDRKMPEEINRILIDHISDFLFATESSAVKNLTEEGIPRGRIFLVGNVMIDTLLKSKTKIQKSKILQELGLRKKDYAILTLHRPSNVDDKQAFLKLLSTFNGIQKKIKIVYPVHPRTKKQIQKFGMGSYLGGMKNFVIIPPLGYVDMMKLVSESKFLLTDSGGLQGESTFLKIPCLTLRKNTERPITVAVGSNVLCSNDEKKILREVDRILNGKYKRSKIPKFWDGRSAERILRIIYDWS